jgi:hypothetical protein
MGIIKLLFNVLKFDLQLNCAAAIASMIVLLYCGPLWGYAPDLFPEVQPVVFAEHHKNSFPPYPSLAKRDKKRWENGSGPQDFKKWQELSPEEKEKMREKYQEWESLPPDQKQIFRQRMNQLDNMPPQQRKMYQQLFQQWQHNLSPGERKQLQRDLDNWEQLSPQQKESIRNRFKN